MALRIPSSLEKPQERKNPRDKYCVTTQECLVFHGSTREGGTGHRSFDCGSHKESISVISVRPPPPGPSNRASQGAAVAVDSVQI